MKILYDDIALNKDFNHFKEWYSLLTGVNRIKKKGYFGKSSFLTRHILLICIYVLAAITWFDIYKHNEESFLDIVSIILIAFSIFCIILYILSIIGYFSYYHIFKKQSLKKEKNTLTIEKDGINDVSEDITVSNNWNQLTYVLIGEYYIMITTNSNIVYLFPIDIKEKLLSGIKKYNSNEELKFIEKII